MRIVIKIFASFLLIGFSVSYGQIMNKKINVRELYKIGQHTVDKEAADDYFGNIIDLVTDREGNLYILDSRLLEIKIYDRNGDRLKRITLQRGKGPGEVINPKHIGITLSGKLYVACQANRTLTIYSQDGEYIDSVKLPFLPSGLALSADKVYLTSWWLTESESIVKRYSHNLNYEKSFLDKPQNALLVARTGNFAHMQTNANGNLIYSSMPYRILELSPEGEILNQASGQPKFTELPKVIKIGNHELVIMQQGSRGLAVSPDGKILNIVQSKEDYYIDVFSPDLKFIFRIEAKQFGINRLRYITTDPYGDIYLDVYEPLPHLRKYSLEFH